MGLKLLLAGSKSFGAAVMHLALELGHEFALITSPEGDGDNLYLAARGAGLRWVPGNEFTPDKFGGDVDLLLSAHAQAFISDDVLFRTRLGGLGYHPSLLPRHRGKDAIRWAVHMKDFATGGTLYWLSEDVDAGDIFSQGWCWITPDDDASTLWRDKLFPMGIELFRQALVDISQGHVRNVRQDERMATWEPSWRRPPLRTVESVGVDPSRPVPVVAEFVPTMPQAAVPIPEMPVRRVQSLVFAAPAPSNGNASSYPPEPESSTRPMSWQLLDAVLRRYHEFLSLNEAEGVDEITVAGHTINVHDLLQGIDELPPRQKQAVILTCIEDMREVDAAAIMLPGSKSAAPVGAYKRKALRRLAARFYHT